MYKYFQICFSDNDVKKILANEQNRYTLTHTHTHAPMWEDYEWKVQPIAF